MQKQAGILQGKNLEPFFWYKMDTLCNKVIYGQQFEHHIKREEHAPNLSGQKSMQLNKKYYKSNILTTRDPLICTLSVLHATILSTRNLNKQSNDNQAEATYANNQSSPYIPLKNLVTPYPFAVNTQLSAHLGHARGGPKSPQ